MTTTHVSPIVLSACENDLEGDFFLCGDDDVSAIVFSVGHLPYCQSWKRKMEKKISHDTCVFNASKGVPTSSLRVHAVRPFASCRRIRLDASEESQLVVQ